ncbi:MAG: hypothetical protein ACK4GR_00605 [bacterium]
MKQVSMLFDFDGVLFDSSWEVTTVILLVYYSSFPDSNISKYFKNTVSLKLLSSLKNYSAEHVFKTLRSENTKINNIFRKLRTYCIDVDDFFVVSQLVDNHFFDLKNLTFRFVNHNFYYSYKKQTIENKKEELEKFIKTFYDVRKYIKENNENFWIILNEPFEKELNTFLEFYKKYNVGILSTKQKYAILTILHYYNIPVDSSKVFAKENEFIHKGKKIKEIINYWNIKEEDLHFVDDLIENLLKVKDYNKNVNLYITSWGYSNYYHRNLARKNGIRIINNLSQIENYI